MANLFESDPRFGALIPPEVQTEIIESAVKESVVLSRFKRLANMTSRQVVLNVRSVLPMVGAVDGYDEPNSAPTTRTFMKPVTDQKFDPRNIYAGEFAAVKIFRNADLSDALAAGNDIIRGDIPLFSSQFGAAIDTAVYWGRGKPPEWATIDSLWRRANANNAIVTRTNDIYGDIFGTDGVRDKILLTGYMPTGFTSALNMMGILDGLRDVQGRPIFVDTLRNEYPYALRGIPLGFSENGAWDVERALMMMADFSKLVYSVREDITWKIDTSGTYTDQRTGEVHYCGQQNKTALVMHMRMGWNILDPVTQLSKNPLPFAFLAPGN